MDKIWWLFAIAILIIISVLFAIIKSELNKLKNTVRLNNESNKKDILIAKKDIYILDSEIKNTHKNLDSCNLRLDKAAITIRNISQQIEENEKQLIKKYDELTELIKKNATQFDNEISNISKSITDIKSANEELKNQLAIFTEIDADSRQLNASDAHKEPESAASKSDNEASNEFELDNEQEFAFNLMNNSTTNLFITGKAGTGKSFLLKHFVMKTEKKTIVLAPTGIAALNAKGVTIHSAFGWENLRLDNTALTKTNLVLKSEKKQVLKHVDTIIIDEISMVRADIFEKMDKILKIINNNDLPFGGKQIILFGDLFQLPPIADKEELKYLKDTFGDKYFFCSDAYKNGNFDFYELTINHRQKDDATFFEILNNIRENKVSENDLEILNKRTEFERNELRRVVELFPRKGEVENVNQRELDKIPSKEYVYKCEIKYIKNDLTIDIEKATPVSENLKLKLGALVMMVANDKNKRWVNGTLAIVSYIKKDCIKVKIDGSEYEVLPISFTQHETVYENGEIKYKTIFKIEQYPMVLAYAITIHKSQGMTYKKIACDVSNCFEPGQVYVALSRCTSIDGLYLLKNVDKKMLGIESEVLDFYKKERNKVNKLN